ncbi:MAG TPA: hypothetical protein VFI47_15110 [Acidimicrobiales bacterium]|nr:hypothetical protein [Acidimicrobiales bacterium]
MPDDEWGQRIAAAVLRPGAHASPDERLDWVRPRRGARHPTAAGR